MCLSQPVNPLLYPTTNVCRIYLQQNIIIKKKRWSIDTKTTVHKKVSPEEGSLLWIQQC